MSRWRDRIRISGGFWLLAAWFTLVNGWQLLAVILSAAALHELGHLLVLRLLGARVRELRVSVFGAELVTSAARLSYPGEIAAVLAGPAVNLLCALGLGAPTPGWRRGPTCHCACSTCCRCGPGRRPGAVSHGRMAGGPRRRGADRPLGGGVTALALGGLVLWLIGRTGGSLWLLPAAFGLLAAALRELPGRKADFCKKHLHFPPGRGILLRLQRVVLCRARAGVRRCALREAA